MYNTLRCARRDARMCDCALAIGGLVGLACASTAVGVYWSKRHAAEDGPPALYDIVHARIPAIPTIVPDVLLVACVVAAAVVALPHRARPILGLVRRVAYILCVRGITVSVTAFPTCVPEGGVHSRHDLMFSGHTVLFQALGDIVALENEAVGALIKWACPVSLVVARQHYTADVVVAAAVYACL
jgi:hypothetical protein